jgi:hypothetical protein
VRDAFHYCLCLVMVEAGVMRPVEKVSGERGEVYVFQTRAGDRFHVARPDISKEQEAALIDVLREILKDEGAL